MSEQEYFDWKKQHPKEWDDIYKKVCKDFTEAKKGHKDDEVMMRAIAPDPNQREFTYGRVKKALENKNDCCDMFVRIHKQYDDYMKNKKEKQND